MASEGKCPFSGATRGPSNRDWWPSQVDVGRLNQHAPQSDPMGRDFDYAEEFKTLDLDAVIKDLRA